ncbi:hypothetical protein [Streptomyces sp. NPDC059970]|uniref:hypothetical protein n=1 Tax=Streptomyces sp. NPDC059970 TaxID=3347019 RepID=UPI0036C21870
MPYDIGDQFGERQLGRIGHVEEPPGGEVKAQDAAQMPGRVLAHREVGMVGRLHRISSARINYVIHVTSVQWVDYARLRTETNVVRR